MSSYRIQGGRKLRGSVEVGSGKNAPIAILSATLMIKGKVRLKNMSRVEEVNRMLEVFESINVKYVWEEENTLLVDSSKPLKMDKIDKELCAKMRISLLMLGALAKREKSYKLYKSGGCQLGQRTVRPHLYALEKYGVSIKEYDSYYAVTNKPLKAAEIIMHESGDTATENAIMGAVLAPGVTTIKYASANYMVQYLCHFLNSVGAKIKGIGTTTLEIIGVKSLRSIDEYWIAPDPVDAMAWISLAITTRSPLTIKNCALDFLELELEHLKVMGQQFEILNKRKSKNKFFAVVDIKIKPSSLKALPDKLHGRPYPGVNIDNVPLFVPILTQAEGQTMVHDWMYENRALYNLEFQKLGAKVTLLDPHRTLIEGPTNLHAAQVICPPALRPGMAILIAMLAAKGESILRDAYPVERGYEKLLERLHQIGAKVEKI